MLTFIHQYIDISTSLQTFSAGNFTMLMFYNLGKLLRGIGKITCQTFKPSLKTSNKIIHFQNGAPFTFDKSSLPVLECQSQKGCLSVA